VNSEAGGGSSLSSLEHPEARIESCGQMGATDRLAGTGLQRLIDNDAMTSVDNDAMTSVDNDAMTR
jgi:hypothetical protein